MDENVINPIPLEIAIQLCDEIREELDTGIEVGREVFRTSHAYPERIVELRFFESRLLGEPQPLLGQEMRWVLREELDTLEFPPADAELIRRLRNNPTAGPANASPTARLC